MSCQSFGDLLNQYGSIIKNVCCLEVEVNNIRGCYFANVLNTTCLEHKDYLPSEPATYLFLVYIQTFTCLFGNYSYSAQLPLYLYKNYFPLYVGSTGNFPKRYNEFILSLWSGMRFPHVFGGKLHEHLRKLSNFQSMKMCLLVFYTYKKDQAKCIEYFIFNHNDFCKIFNKKQPECPPQVNQQQPFGKIAQSIIQTIQALQSCP